MFAEAHVCDALTSFCKANYYMVESLELSSNQGFYKATLKSGEELRLRKLLENTVSIEVTNDGSKQVKLLVKEGNRWHQYSA